MAITKTELVASIASATGESQATVSRVVDGLFSSVSEAVAKGEKVSLAGFGTFEPRERSARTGRNPQTGEPVQIAASTAPAFKPASAFKDAVNS